MGCCSSQVHWDYQDIKIAEKDIKTAIYGWFRNGFSLKKSKDNFFFLN
jgi:hypothetical protein